MTNQRESAPRRAAPRKHYKCAACKTFYRKPVTAENHIFRQHGGIGIIVFDQKGKA